MRYRQIGRYTVTRNAQAKRNHSRSSRAILESRATISRFLPEFASEVLAKLSEFRRTWSERFRSILAALERFPKFLWGRAGRDRRPPVELLLRRIFKYRTRAAHRPRTSGLVHDGPRQFFAIAVVSVSTQSYSASFQSFRSSVSAVIPIQRRRIERPDRSDFEMCRARFFLLLFPFPLSFVLSVHTYVHTSGESYWRNANTMHIRIRSHENGRRPRTRESPSPRRVHIYRGIGRVSVDRNGLCSHGAR